jgi:undecaprenyl phosphate-alpha-L-ara4FN deformylase
LIGTDGLDAGNVASALLRLTEVNRDQVFTLHAELEGGLLAPTFEDLLSGWRAQGHELVDLGALFAGLDRSQLPVLPIAWGAVSGRSGELIVAPAAA